jgi:electron transfer flavoprotein beta subunit
VCSPLLPYRWVTSRRAVLWQEYPSYESELPEDAVKIAVCVKQVPDTWAEKRLREQDATLDREAADGVMNELDEYAVEEALRLAEAQAAAGGSAEVVVVSMGPERAGETIRKALSMGADAGLHIADDALHGSDALATSAALARALEGRAFDLIIFGSESTDARMSVVPAMVAERLGVAQLTFAQQVNVNGTTVQIQRVTESGYDTVEAQLPAVVSVVEKINEPRYPSFKGIMAAKKKPVDVVDIASLGLEPAVVGLGAAWSKVDDFAARPSKAAGVIVKDEGDGGARIAAFLAEQKLL